MHIRKLTVANLAAPLKDAEGKPVPALEPVSSETLDLSNLPKTASPAPPAPRGKKPTPR